ncbi:MAG: rhodanese-like domain-containing protein [Nakamurella sp.]
MTGNMSAIAGRTLTALGYTDVLELGGGMAAWQGAGLSLIPPNQ